MSKQFVKISREFGFNRNRLLYWEFQPGEEEEAHLWFEGTIEVVIRGDLAQTFRNWTETEAEEAPETYQHTLFSRPQDIQDLKQISAQQRPK